MPGPFVRYSELYNETNIDLKNDNKIIKLIKIEKILKENEFLPINSKNELYNDIILNFDFNIRSDVWVTFCYKKIKTKSKYLNIELDLEYFEKLKNIKNEWKKTLLDLLNNIKEIRRSQRLNQSIYKNINF